ncbi:hypothetical protein N0V93_007973 [Gnomoniopsis smithogilvyi]|uniref:Uncharacterized protein n=1 Tax=Gnomoniopsis smithogilvyi TaxID=1191159 RepID=A0A9W8YL51_9PEZI|nr:hypothetical protein N0V93_007973 [Gnomoniopsis smithogilvyi]
MTEDIINEQHSTSCSFSAARLARTEYRGESMSKFFNFRMLPSELRLRILRHTHLGPPDTGGYDARVEHLIIRNQRLVPWYFQSGFKILAPLKECTADSPVNLPKCQRRILPVALFLVDRKMYQEAAFEVFYPNAVFDFYQDDLGATLTFLRDIIPREALPRLRRICFTMAQSPCVEWGELDTSCDFPDDFPPWSRRPDPQVNRKSQWRDIVSLLADHADLPRLSLTVHFYHEWGLIEDAFMHQGSHWPVEWFRFLYNVYMDVATELCRLKTLLSVNFDVYVFQALRPWVEREILGQDNEGTSLLPRRLRSYQQVPPWHDENKRLNGSNYHPDVS